MAPALPSRLAWLKRTNLLLPVVPDVVSMTARSGLMAVSPGYPVRTSSPPSAATIRSTGTASAASCAPMPTGPATQAGR